MKCVKMFVLGSVLAFGLAAQAQTAPVTPAAAAVTAPAASPTPEPVVPVAEVAAPPQWAQNLLVTAEKLPTIGPILSKGLVYLGILVSILTAGVGFLLTLLSALSGIAGLSDKLSGFASAIQSFQNGKIMYWLKYLSMFNAQKTVAPAVASASAPADSAQKAA